MKEFPDMEYIRAVCKIGQGHECCRYLTTSVNGWSCEKRGKLRWLLDKRVDYEQMVARGDNCEGRESR